jgi:hypothetical protein
MKLSLMPERTIGIQNVRIQTTQAGGQKSTESTREILLRMEIGHMYEISNTTGLI